MRITVECLLVCFFVNKFIVNLYQQRHLNLSIASKKICTLQNDTTMQTPNNSINALLAGTILPDGRRVVRIGATVEEYLAFEDASQEKHEFHDGTIITLHGDDEYVLLHSGRKVIRTGATMEEYVAFENASEERHEFHNGDIIAMPGNTSHHERLVYKILRTLGNQLPDEKYAVFPSNLKIMIPTYHRFIYPDITIVRGVDEYNDAEQRELLNPTAIIEILSPSTAHRDLTDKFEYYRSIPSLEEVAFFAQDRINAELFRKNAQGRWEIVEIEHSIVELASVQANISLAEIYPPNRLKVSP
jgi:Uma2 family endonuclease